MKKLVGLIVAGTMVVSMIPTVFAADGFSDMPTDYSTASLEAAVAKGLLNGNDGKIMPDANLTRAEMATILVRALGHAELADISVYEDVKSGDWFYDEIGHAVYMELFKGDGETMRPQDSITRQEAFVVLSRAFGLTAEDISALAPFVDASSVATWAQADVAAMVETGFVQGDGIHLNPLSNISRKDFAVVMDRMVETYITEAGTYNEVPAGSVVVNTPDVNLKDMDIDGFLVIGDGAWNGDISLSNVSADALVVRGGGLHTVTISDNSSFKSLSVHKSVGHVRFLVDDSASLGNVVVPENKVQVIFEGNVSNMEVAANSTVYIRSGDVDAVNLTGENAKVVLEESASATTVTTHETASNATIVIGTGTAVGDVAINGENTKVIVEENATVNTVSTNETAKAVTVTVAKDATISDITVAGEGSSVELAENAKVEKLTTTETAHSSNVTVATGATVADVTVSGSDTKLDVATGGTVASATVAGTGSTITGSGTVTDVVVSGNDVKVETEGTKVDVAEGTTGTTAGSEDVAGGTTVTTPVTKPTTTVPSVGGSSTTAFTATDITFKATVNGIEIPAIDGTLDLRKLSGDVTSGIMTATINSNAAKYASGTASFAVGSYVNIATFISDGRDGRVDSASGAASVEAIESLVANLYGHQDIIDAKSKIEFTITEEADHYKAVVTGGLKSTSSSYTGTVSYNLTLLCDKPDMHS